VDAAVSCRLSARGHRWREPKLAAQRLKPNPTLRVCECGATGYVNKQGVIEVDWEPPSIGKLAPLGIEHPCDRLEVRAIVLQLGELEVEYRAGGRGVSSYLAARDDLVRQLMEQIG
jgi:hypothetical protein